jgi:hypothetical protein
MLLHLDGTALRIHDAGEFHNYPVAGCFDYPPPMLRDLWVDQFAAMRLEVVKRTRAPEAGIADDIGDKYGGRVCVPRRFWSKPFSGAARPNHILGPTTNGELSMSQEVG